MRTSRTYNRNPAVQRQPVAVATYHSLTDTSRHWKLGSCEWSLTNTIGGSCCQQQGKEQVMSGAECQRRGQIGSIMMRFVQRPSDEARGRHTVFIDEQKQANCAT